MSPGSTGTKSAGTRLITNRGRQRRCWKKLQQQEEDDDLTPEPASLQSVIHGKPDSELPSLLSDFLKATSEIVAKKPLQPVATEQPELNTEDTTTISSVEGIEIAMGENMPSFVYPIAPRMRPDAKFPYFAKTTSNSQTDSTSQ